jgi:thiol:disulfide interchange protein DsbC
MQLLISRIVKAAGLFVVLGCVAAGARAEGVTQDIVDNMAKLVPGLTAKAVSPTPVPGIYEVAVDGRILYLSGDGRYLFRGDLVDVLERTNLTEAKRKQTRKTELAKLDPAEMIIFKAADLKHQVTIFTDVDCGYCAKLHRQMAEYNDLGIEIRYLAFPRAGIGSKSYHTTVSVWCSDDPRQAIGLAKARRPVASKTCPNPVERHFETGRMLGVNGTPTIITQDGTIIPGYVPPEQMFQQLEKQS